MRPFGDIRLRPAVVVAGALGTLALFAGPARADGEFDRAFADGGRLEFALASATGSLGDLVVLGDGSVVATGRSEPGGLDLARATPGGLLDTAFGSLTGLEDVGGRALLRLADGGVLVAGDQDVPVSAGEAGAAPLGPGPRPRRAVLAGFTRTGVTDTTYATAGLAVPPLPGSDASFGALAASGGMFLAAGDTTINGARRFLIARLDRNGVLDPSFGSGGVVTIAPEGGGDASVRALLVDTGGAIVAAGGATVAGDQRAAVVRLTADGRPDVTFGGGDGAVTFRFGAAQGEAADVTIQPGTGVSGRRILVAGSAGFTGRRRYALARLLANGAADRRFGTRGFASAPDVGGTGATRMVLNPNRTIVLAGGGRADGDGVLALARFLPQGTLDTSFGGDGFVTTVARSGGSDAARGLVRRVDGTLVAGGSAGAAGDHEWLLARFRQACGSSLGCVSLAPVGREARLAVDPAAPVRLGALVLSRGRPVGTVILGRVAAGPVELGWDLRVKGRRLPRGVYRVRLRSLDGSGRIVAAGPEIRLPVP